MNCRRFSAASKILASLLIAAASAQAANTFKATTGAMGTNRGDATASLMETNKVLVAGGLDFSNVSSTAALATAEVYDPATDTWSATAPMHTARTQASAVVLGNGAVLVFGGHDGNTVLSSAELYDPVLGTWSAAGSLATGRYYCTATLLQNGQVLVAGGWDGTQNLATCELYDPTGNSWSAAGSLATARFLSTATLLDSTGKVLVAGGKNATLHELASAEIYDPTGNSWSPAAAMTIPHWHHSATALRGGKVLVAGGTTTASIVTGVAELYDPVANTWTATGSMLVPTSDGVATLLATGKVLVTGGHDKNSLGLATATLYDSGTGKWTATGTMAGTRFSHSATLLRNGRVLVAGGSTTTVAPPKVIPRAEVFDASLPTSSFNGLVDPSFLSSASLPGTPPASRAAKTGAKIFKIGGPDAQSLGFFTATVQDTRSFSGKLTMQNGTVPVVGTFDGTGLAHFGAAGNTLLVIERLNQPSFTISNLRFDFSTPHLSATLTGGVVMHNRSLVVVNSGIRASQGFFDGLTPGTTMPSQYLGTAGADGAYTVILPALDLTNQPSGFTTADYPQGTGFGTLKITKKGVVSTALKLADGTACTTSTPVVLTTVSQLSFPLFTQLYTNTGFIEATIVLDSTNAVSDLAVDLNRLRWMRPFLSNQYYPYGWPEVITTGFSAAKYTVVAGSSVLPGITPPGPGNPGNAQLHLTGGLLTANFDRGLILSNADVLTKITVGDTSYSLAITRSTGNIGGYFTHTDGTKPAYQGIIYQKGTLSAGLGFFLSTSPKVLTYDGQSGSMKLSSH